MKFNTAALLAFATSAAAHSTWQQLWVNGVDKASTCARLPANNSPVGTTEAAVRCGNGNTFAPSVCEVNAGGTITIEMHAQPGDRSCNNDAIGGNHDGPVIVYLQKVDNALTSSGAGQWFKIYQNGLVSKDYWGTDVLNANCGKQDLKIPADIAPGDYLLRTEVIALHVAGSPGGAQHYVSCFQLKVTGGGSANPSGVTFPGGYSANDPGILFNLYGQYTSYPVPGPPVYTGGAGGGNPSPQPTSTATSTTTQAPQPTSTTTQQPQPTQTQPSGGSISKWAQCGGIGWTGSGTCVSGSTCVKLNDYYSQCQ
ncbi:hypothetical protein BJ508DRAFT_67612 [Ascobolus immersus RN42]|uniref:AA9 family lytic polysaccharide monooxygenase n=1 Tax=Ascobolus immersus RN42 TaxID=1160509 RepID=A0A3N4HJN8_ASCIM|nr:hypothetical protein BJ508DRAFT_67612 [Ascobolus immersus RN42]